MPGNTLCRLSPSGALVARITSRAAIRTRTFVPASEHPIGREQRASIEGQLEKSTFGISSYDTRLENAAQANGIPKPWQVRTTRQIGQRAARDRAPWSRIKQMRGQANDVVEIMCHEHERDVERPSQLVDLILQSSSHRSIDGGKRLVEQQHGRLASQRSCERHALTLAP